MAHITITEKVRVDIRIDGVTIAEDFTPGNFEVAQPVADLLIAQGLAQPTTDIAGPPVEVADDSTTSKKKTTPTASSKTSEA